MIAPIEVSPASAAGQIKIIRVSHDARKQVVFQLTDDRGQPVDLKAEVVNPPAEVANWFPRKQAVGANAKIRIRSEASQSNLGGGSTFNLEGTILDQNASRGFCEFQLEPEHTACVGIHPLMVERYIENGDEDWRIDTWPLLMAVEPGAMAMLNTRIRGPLLLPEIRLAMLDLDNQNDGAPFSNLLDDTEFTDLDLVFAQRRAVELWNETPPPVRTYTPANFPYRYHWLECTIGQLMLMSAQRYRRNRLAYQAGGIAIDDQSKADEYQRYGQEKIDRFMEWMRNEKYRINMNSTWATGI